jgi:putative acetyltransferase
MIKFLRADSTNPDFIELVKHLDADLAERDGEDHPFYAQFNKINMIKHALVAYENDQPVGCGAIKHFSDEAVEVKRMYVPVHMRGKGIASQVLSELEKWAREMNYRKCVLETGQKQPEAIALYTRNGYSIIPNFGQYAGIENSVCFEKELIS